MPTRRHRDGRYAPGPHAAPPTAAPTLPLALPAAARPAPKLKAPAPGSVEDDRLARMAAAYRAYLGYQKTGIPDEVRDLGEDLHQQLDQIDFWDGRPGHQQDKATVADCADPDVATGNSEEVTGQVGYLLARLRRQDTRLRDWSVEAVRLSFTGAHHDPDRGDAWAVQLTDGQGRSWVLDYTARQFDDRAPFPLAQPRELWQEWVIKHVESDRDGVTFMAAEDFPVD